MDFNIAHFNMVHQQVRPWGVIDTRVLDALSITPRTHFVPSQFQNLAFSDIAIPIGHAQVMLPPSLVGRILQALQLNGTETVLEIGTGTGYMTLLLAQLAKKITSLEIIPELSETAARLLETFGPHTLDLDVGDAVSGWPSSAPYDVIVYTGALPYLPNTLRDQVSLHGRIFAILGNEPNMSAVLLTRTGEDQWMEQPLFETVVPILINAPEMEKFRF